MTDMQRSSKWVAAYGDVIDAVMALRDADFITDAEVPAVRKLLMDAVAPRQAAMVWRISKATGVEDDVIEGPDTDGPTRVVHIDDYDAVVDELREVLRQLPPRPTDDQIWDAHT